MLIFDESGHLNPGQPIASDLAELESVFVFNEKRRLIFNDLLAFLEKISALEPGNIQVWIDGSFVTKKAFPRDVDIVLFLENQEFFKNEKMLHKIKRDYRNLVDSYFIPVFPAHHLHFNLYNSDRLDWQFLFSRDRQKRKKGFLQIDF